MTNYGLYQNLMFSYDNNNPYGNSYDNIFINTTGDKNMIFVFKQSSPNFFDNSLYNNTFTQPPAYSIIDQIGQWFSNMWNNIMNAPQPNPTIPYFPYTPPTDNTQPPITDTTPPPTDNTQPEIDNLVNPEPPIDPKEAMNTLLKNWDMLDTAAGKGKRDGIVSRDDLKAIANSSSLDPELKKAAQYLIDNPAVFNMLDHAGAKSKKMDGKLSTNDINTAMNNGWLNGLTPPENFDASKMSTEDAARIIYQNFTLFDTATGKGERDGRVSSGDLRTIVNSSSLPEHVRAAAQYFLDNKPAWNMVEAYNDKKGKLDDRLTIGDLEKFLP
ncbi:MAG: hypothetical protein AB1782_04175 [Cyanobacteriota bacterium]